MVKQPACQTPYPEFSKCIEREVQGDDRYSWWKNWLWVSLLLPETIPVTRNEADVNVAAKCVTFWCCKKDVTGAEGGTAVCWNTCWWQPVHFLKEKSSKHSFFTVNKIILQWFSIVTLSQVKLVLCEAPPSEKCKGCQEVLWYWRVIDGRKVFSEVLRCLKCTKLCWK